MKYASAFRHSIDFVGRTLMTLQFLLDFFLKRQFLFKCWEVPIRKKFRQFLEICPSFPQDLHLKPILSFLLKRFTSSEISVSVDRYWRWKTPPTTEPAIVLLFSVTSVITLPSPRTTSFPLLITTVFRCFSSTDNWFTSLVTAPTIFFVLFRLITATFGVCSSSSVLVAALRCNTCSEIVSIFISLSPICFHRSNLTWLWFICSRNPLKTRWSLTSCAPLDKLVKPTSLSLQENRSVFLLAAVCGKLVAPGKRMVFRYSVLQKL